MLYDKRWLLLSITAVLLQGCIYLWCSTLTLTATASWLLGTGTSLVTAPAFILGLFLWRRR